MRIRPCQPPDLEPLLALFTASVHGLGRAHYDPAQLAAWAPPAPDLAGWKQRLERAHTLVAEVDGQLAGFLSCQLDGHIDLLFVAPDHARRGVATRLFAQAQAMLVAAGIRELTTEASLVARPFFERQGFIVHETQSVERQGVVLRRHAMRKQLPAAAGQLARQAGKRADAKDAK